MLTVFFPLVLTGWKCVQKRQNVGILFDVHPHVSGSTCQWAYHNELVNGCDFPNSGLGRRQNGLWNNSGSLGWVGVRVDVLSFRS